MDMLGVLIRHWRSAPGSTEGTTRSSAVFGPSTLHGAVSSHGVWARVAQRRQFGGIMHAKLQRLVLLVVSVGGLFVTLSAPANAATNQLSGVAVLDTTGACPPPPAGY